MKVVMVKNNIKEGMIVVEKSISDTSHLPILKNVLIEAVNGKIKFTTTNLEVGVVCITSGKVIEDGKVSVPAQIFSNLINNLQTERINLDTKNNNLIIKTDNYEALIQGLPIEEFPIIPKVGKEKGVINCKGEIFKEALYQILTTSQFSDLRPELNSVLLDLDLERIKLVTTDSFRLSEKTIPHNNFTTTLTNPIKILLPLKTSYELLRILVDNEDLEINIDNSQILFKTEKWEFISRLIEGNFPEYTSIIPTKFNSDVVLNKQEFINSLKLVSVFSSRVSEIKIKTLENKKALEIVSAEQGLGENIYILPAKVQGSIRDIGFNWRYLLDGLKAIKTSDVFIGFNEDNKPALLKSPTDSSYLYVLMPVMKTG